MENICLEINTNDIIVSNDRVIFAHMEKDSEECWFFCPFKKNVKVLSINSDEYMRKSENIVFLGTEKTTGIDVFDMAEEVSFFMKSSNIPEAIFKSNEFIANYLRAIALLYGGYYFERYNDYYFSDVRNGVTDYMLRYADAFAKAAVDFEEENSEVCIKLFAAVDEYVKEAAKVSKQIDALGIFERTFINQETAEIVTERVTNRLWKYGPLKITDEVVYRVLPKGGTYSEPSAIFISYKRKEFKMNRAFLIESLHERRRQYLGLVKNMLMIKNNINACSLFDKIETVEELKEYLLSKRAKKYVHPVLRLGVYEAVFNSDNKDDPFIFDGVITMEDQEKLFDLAEAECTRIADYFATLYSLMENTINNR